MTGRCIVPPTHVIYFESSDKTTIKSDVHCQLHEPSSTPVLDE